MTTGNENWLEPSTILYIWLESSADIFTVIISLYSSVHMKEAYVNRDKTYGYVIMKLYTGMYA